VTSTGFGRVLVALYAVMAVGACSRSAVQIATAFDDAPVAYLLSAFAAVVYVLATVGLARRGRAARRTATLACTVELVGVLTVGTFTVFVPSDFPDETVWSLYGQGYVFIPLVLPVLGLWWLRRTAPRS
jgi:NhaP-type Na+/H+ and K+/H+ antiporter